MIKLFFYNAALYARKLFSIFFMNKYSIESYKMIAGYR